jgi:hypothetical protein
MTRGVRPIAGIGEAKRRATAWGFRLVEVVMEDTTPFDFVFCHNGSTILVRVRRLKYNAYRAESIRVSCAQQIRELREPALLEGIGRELWVRGPQRAWHRYRIMQETIEEITDIPSTGSSPVETGTVEKTGIPDKDHTSAAGIVNTIQ